MLPRNWFGSFVGKTCFRVVASTQRFRTSVVGLEAAKPPRSSASSSKPGEWKVSWHPWIPWVDWEVVWIFHLVDFFIIWWVLKNQTQAEYNMRVCHTNMDYISPMLGVKIQNFWNHHLVRNPTWSFWWWAMTWGGWVWFYQGESVISLCVMVKKASFKTISIRNSEVM